MAQSLKKNNSYSFKINKNKLTPKLQKMGEYLQYSSLKTITFEHAVHELLAWSNIMATLKWQTEENKGVHEFFVLTAETGIGKSQVQRKLSELYNIRKQKLYKEYENQYERYNLEIERWKKKKKNDKTTLQTLIEIKPQKPISPYIWISEGTTEALYEQLSDKRGIPVKFMRHAEAESAFGEIGGVEQATKIVWILNSIWSNEQRSKSLVKYEGAPKETLLGMSVIVDWCFKPSTFKKMVNFKDNKSNGLIGRMLICEVKEEGDVNINTDEFPMLEEWIEWAAEQIITSTEDFIKGNDPRKIIQFSPAIKDRILEYRKEIDEERRKGGIYEEIKDEAVRAGEHLVRLAVTVMALDNGVEMTNEYLDCAIELTRWYLTAYLEDLKYEENEEEAIAIKFRNWVYKNNLYDRMVTFRDVQRGVFNHLPKLAKEEMITHLEELGLLKYYKDIDKYLDPDETKLTKRGIRIASESMFYA